MKSFTEPELTEFKTKLSDVMIKVDKIETKLKALKDEYKIDLDPLKKEVKELLTWIRDKARSVTEECYIMFEGEFAVYYNEWGEEIYRRPLQESERQRTIQMEIREGTNN
ncbi:MAG: hypothetical protein PHW73_01140 [Atribacterota bacterium]|nr:hypothetical protein [Atribacterota bacterium]